ncbi:MAG: alpha/beta hydrolase [Cyanobacteria bacterium P01_F01_bin.42]
MQTIANGIKFKLLTPSNPNLNLLIFIPGLDGSDLSIKNQLDNLKSEFEVAYLSIAVDNKMRWDELTNTSASLIKDELSKAYSDSNESRKIFLCGESFGACLALAMAAQAPGFFTDLVLINPATSYKNQAWSPLVSALAQQLPKAFYQLSTLMLLPLLITGNRVTQNNQQLLLKAMQAFKPQDLACRLSLLQTFHISLESLQGIRVPVLLISATGDKLLPSSSEVKKISKLLPKSKIIQLPRSGHACLLEENTNLGEIIRRSNLNQ